ncbi:meiotically up-regulated gene 56 protein [Didymella exigua CBS 183.55]|uniref:Meiotically up-regulated gene 56 protein n=1 Tax=Didymella exigua CBS 183.55 TaxID=1150837 RepID=A0A6A5RQZ1_9PLEO|nr:meiotically up-regulated gene 56 protein [Didymella exigua CBS 183.55]KAF1930182.1 meiotically up-regulated gene 56 protein [Didymella exigua CBS 183.55]
MPAPEAPRPWHQQPDTIPLSPESFTAQKLQHATPEHLDLTSRRFFIGPVPTAWLSKHRRDWYKHHLGISYSSRAATFSSDPREARQRRLSGAEGPSASALFQHSFPQPEELDAEDGAAEDGAAEDAAAEDGAAEDGAAKDGAEGAQGRRGNDVVGSEAEEFVDAPSEPGDVDADADADADDGDLRVYTHEGEEYDPAKPPLPHRESTRSFVTASSMPIAESDGDEGEGAETPRAEEPQPAMVPGGKSRGKLPLSAVTHAAAASTTRGPPSVDADSTSSLLRDADVNKAPPRGILARAKRRSSMGLFRTDTSTGPEQPTADLLQPTSDLLQPTSDLLQPTSDLSRPTSDLSRPPQDPSRKPSHLRNLVRFDVPDDSRRQAVHLKAKKAQMTIQRAGTKLRRKSIKDGLVVKMERMLVRVDAADQVPDDFDENVSQRVVSRVKEKWREYMVVCRHSHTDGADFLLQLYQTRVIPEIAQPGAGKRAAYEIPLGRKTSKLNLYSSLDKSIVVSTPGSRGTLIFIMQSRTASNAVEWYTFLRNVLGWRRASELHINIPDMSLSVRVANPFEKLEASQSRVQDADDTEEAILKTMQEEQAVAQALIRQCLDQLEDAPEWASVLEAWTKEQRIGLAWKRYDRLEWIHGANERKMYGTIAMLKSHDLELRPKTHYPTTAVTRNKHKTLTEPVPVEGFLIRLTGQRGRAKRLGLMYHKQLYFATHDQYLVFSRPTKATPPRPPRLPASNSSAVPTSQAIRDTTPDSWAVNPYPVQDKQIEWLRKGHTGTSETKRLHDEDAADEFQRNQHNLLNCDGYIDMTDMVKVRKARLGASPADQDMEPGSDVDFDQDVDMDDSRGEDGATSDIDLGRTFELVMKNGLVVRLQAADKPRRKQWIMHLRALAKYWKHRTASDIALYKSTRARNLSALNIDEEGEALIGQFARKWEVTQSYASPLLYNMCGIACCRTIHMSGTLYRKPRIHAPFTRCSVLLAGGSLAIFADVLRSRVGKQLTHIHHERIANLDLRDCYVYSGLVTEHDLLYQNQTFDANQPGHHALPRVYPLDGWTSTDEDVMTTFVIWHGKARSWFRAEQGAGGGEQVRKEGKRGRVKRVAKLGSKGRSVVFRARSRAERDHWVLAVQNEIERVAAGDGSDFRIERAGK